MENSKPHRLHFSSIHDKGFVLISTIIVMSLLFLIAVASLSMSSVSVRSSNVSNDQYEAQLNARLALIEALSELQEGAGHDQRITFTADFAGLQDGSEIAAGVAPENNMNYDGTRKGVSVVQNGTRHWTGVWKSKELDPGESIYTKTPTAEHVKWLVSGSQSEPSNEAWKVSHNGSVLDSSSVALLVGEHTVGGANSDNVANFVTAPMVNIESKGSVTGRYAWWIGDEGVKARNNIRASYVKDDEAKYEDLLSSRNAWELVKGYQNYPQPGNDTEFDKIIGDGELELVEGSLKGQALQSTFHDSTPHSIGLATNALTGGMKVDLTQYLENGFPASASYLGEPVAGDNIIPKSIAPKMLGPTWKQVASYYSVGSKLAKGTKELTVQAAGSAQDQVVVAPVLSDVRVLLGAKVRRHAGTVYQIFPAAKVVVSIANPYPYPLRWNKDLEFEISSDTPAGIRPSCIWDIGDYCQFLPQYTGSPACFNNAVMSIPADVLAPGEARAYTIGSQVERLWGTAPVNVKLVPISKTDPSNFDFSIIQKNNVGFNLSSGSIRLDVREGTNTSQMTAELRLAGTSDGVLRKIKSFELDNGHFIATTRWLNNYWASRMTRPFGLQLFTFQLSQPGADYGAVLPHQSLLGLGGSTLRTFADYNVRATHYKAPIASYNPVPYFGMSQNSFAQIPFAAPGGDTGPAFTRNLALDPLPWGHSAFGPEKAVLFTFPEKLLSLGQLQHMDLTADDSHISVAHQPGNAFANSYASPLVKRHLTVEERNDYRMVTVFRADPSKHNYYDVSYLLNASIWDKYFLSTIPSTGDAKPQNESIVTHYAGDTSLLRNPQKVASQIGIRGAFNVNSTSKKAWVALLSSTRHLKHPGDGKDKVEGGLFPRSLEQKSAAKKKPSGDEEDSWSGYRRLTDAEIDALAEHIVKQVRLRGPFTSMAHFTNRTLVPLKDSAELGRSGALQSAIDNAGLTVTSDRSATAFENLDLSEDQVKFQHLGKYPRADIEGGRPTLLPNNGDEPLWAPRSADLNPSSIASILSDREILIDANYKNEQGSRSTGIPGWLTQADLLQVLGPVMAVRSDTFRVRAYGESIDPVTGKVKARAWCEAIVQRNPQYIDSSDQPEKEVNSLSEINKKYGRKFNITSFRWLNENEI